MKKYLLFLCGLLIATFSQAADCRTFVLVTAGEVDAALVEGVRAHMQSNVGVVVRLAPAIPIELGQSLDALGRVAVQTLGQTDHSIIVLARPLDDRPQGVCLPQERFAVLNVAKLEVGADPAKLTRRAGQEGIRVMSMLLDMAQCPFPLCVLVGYEKTEDLDQMSANCCPPCQDRFTRLAREAGLCLIEAPAEDVVMEPVAAPVAEEQAPAPVAEPIAAPVVEPVVADPAAVQ